MFKRRKPRRNVRKGKTSRRRVRFFGRFWIGFKIVTGLGLLVAASTGFIFIHDVITQCDYFKARSIVIEGEQRITERQIAELAHVKEKMNLFAINLTAVRKRLLSHPWIAEAMVIREIPSRLIIRIKEHVPLAVVDLGRKFLINEKGEIFKIWTVADPACGPPVPQAGGARPGRGVPPSASP